MLQDLAPSFAEAHRGRLLLALGPFAEPLGRCHRLEASRRGLDFRWQTACSNAPDHANRSQTDEFVGSNEDTCGLTAGSKRP